jgi:ribosomal protein L11 methyltransferase
MSVDVADAAEGTAGEIERFGEPGSDPQPWPRSQLTALLDAAADAADVLARAAAQAGCALPGFEAEPVADDDWVRRTQAQFAPVQAGARLWIVPSWHQPPEPGASNVRIDPGLAFGTGSHATTRLVLRWLDRELRPGDSVLDFGCGSGVLAIAAAMLGGTDVYAVDIDEHAIAAATHNARVNHAAVHVGAPETLPPRAFDVVLANILAGPLIDLAPALAPHVADAGRIVLSGILDRQAEEVAAAYIPWFRIAAWAQEDGWTLLAGTRAHDG